ncbi:hemolysin family protein [Pseudactinotalea sp. HY160]|uniref:hemolysin family protein n=1 Tax=Pseudactinotalea sp. HY160 TaxID=2654490 RepID=UPI001D14D562|nr:hemolysin family protein [Pseudactinotalea sp. HY160]
MNEGVTEAMAAPIPLLVAVAVVAIAAGAILSAGEEAGRSITRAAAHEAAIEGRRRAGALRAIAAIAADSTGPVRATAYLRLVTEMTGAVCVTLVYAVVFERWWVALLCAVATVALLNIVVVGISPRTLGRRRPVAVLALVGPFMHGAHRIMAPFVARVGPSRASGPTWETEGELQDMVDRVAESAHIEDDEREMLQSVFELSRTMVREVMVPRTDMVTVRPDVTLTKALSLFTRSGFSRIPVAGESLDDLRGVLYLKDLLRKLTSAPERSEHRIERVMREAVFVPETKVVDDMLAQMRASGVHIAIAFDEYGGVAGLVTIEDVLEELVGDLTDEHDQSEPQVEPDGDGYRVPARLPLDELGELFDLEIDDPEVDSTGGLLTKALGRVPILGSVALDHGLRFEVVEASGRRRRVSTILVTRAQENSPAEPTTHPEETPHGP